MIMKGFKIYLLLILVQLFISSCTIEPQKIEYGVDACSFCKMTIVDRQHAAELVTGKGKVYKYDAIECMLNNMVEMQNKSPKSFKYILVTDYLTPEKLIDGTKATYLISENIKSPMGANLSAFENQSKAQEFVKNEKDAVFDWEGIQKFMYNE